MRKVLLPIVIIILGVAAALYIRDRYEVREAARKPVVIGNLCDLSSSWRNLSGVRQRLDAELFFTEHGVLLGCTANDFIAPPEGDGETWSKLRAIRNKSEAWSFPVVLQGHFLHYPLYRRMFFKWTHDEPRYPTFVIEKLISDSAPPPPVKPPPSFKVELSTDKDTYKIGEQVRVHVHIENLTSDKLYIRYPVEWGYGASLSFDLSNAHPGILTPRWIYSDILPTPSSPKEYLPLQAHEGIDVDSSFPLKDLGINLPGISQTRVDFHDSVSYYNFGLPVSFIPASSNPVNLTILQ